MSSEAAFLSEIRDRPDDDVPRLVFADWLDDQGEPDRAEFIRTHCRLAALPEWDPARFDLEERALDLLAEHRARWIAHLPRWARNEDLSFRRGILESATLTPATYLRHGDRLAQLIPLTHLKLDDCVRPDELACLGATARLSELEFEWISGDPSAPRHFFDNLDSQRLRRLAMRRGYRSGESREVLADWPGLSRLTDLRVSLTPNVTSLLSSPHLGRLARLALTDCSLDLSACLALAHSERLAGVRRLELSGNGLPSIQTLAAAEWPNLEEFSFHFWCATVADVGPLLTSSAAPRLRALELGGNNSELGGRSLSESRTSALECLKLNQTDLRDAGVAALAEADWLANLTSLRLFNHNLSDAAAEALARSTKLGRLVSLDLTRNHVGTPGVVALVESSRLGALAELCLANARLGERGLAQLAALPGLARFRALTLMNDYHVSPRGIAALAASPHVRVVRLNLSSTSLGDEGATALVQAPWLTGVRELHLSHNQIGNVGVRALANCPALSRLRVLNLLGNRQLTNAGAAALAASPHLGRLLDLGLSGHGIDRGSRDQLRERFGTAVTFGY